MKVLIATDGSTWSHAAIREAARLLPLKDAEVHVVSVANLVPLMTGYESAAAVTMVVDREIAAARIDAEKAVAILAELGVTATAHEREGEAAREILALGRELAPDLVVLGAHGKNALERLFLGSTSDAVIHRWGGAVLVIRPRDAR
jgi:nucleotide-binding universal stress UspA family protein